ncbi:hypothetical protein [Catellatospora methionotrophica]
MPREVFPDDLEEAERRQGVRVRPDDAVLHILTACRDSRVRCGSVRRP